MEQPNINRAIHEFMGLCVHEPKTVRKSDITATGGRFWDEIECSKCGQDQPLQLCPDYTSSDSPRSLLEGVVAKVIEKVGHDDYGYALEGQFGDDHAIDVLGGDAMKFTVLLANATAEQIAKACYACIQGTHGTPEPAPALEDAARKD